MTLEQLKFYCVLARFEHVSKAAEELNISQPALSTTLRRLEDELSVSLFDRRGRKVCLNDYGRAFLPDAIAAVESVENGLGKLHQIKHGRDNTLELLAPELYEYPGLMEEIYRACPEVTLRIHGRFSLALVETHSEHLDMFISSRSEPIPGFKQHMLREYDMFVLLPDTDPLAKKKNISFSDLRDKPFVAKSNSYGSRYCLDVFCQQAGFTPRIIFQADNNRDIFGAVSSGNCIALLTICPQVARLMLDFPHLVPASLESYTYKQPLNLYWPEHGIDKPAARTMQRILIDYFGQRKDDPQELIAALRA